MDSLTIVRPDDWHLHLRDGAALAAVLPATARQFARAIVMPNLKPPVATTAQAQAYRQRILAALPPGLDFEPLMTLYLTDNMPADEIRRAVASGIIHGVKLYPAGATTNSDSGVTDIRKPRAALEAMQELGLPLQVHGEVTHPSVDVFDREKVFIDDVMEPLRRDFPALKVVFEHITTRDAAQYVRDADGPLAATITAHHLLFNRNALFMTADGRAGVRPHYYCLPVLKREPHRSGAGRSRGQRQPPLLPRNRFGAASEGREGNRLRLRRLLHGGLRARAVCRGVRGCRPARSTGGIREPLRSRLLRTAAQSRHRDVAAARMDRASRVSAR